MSLALEEQAALVEVARTVPPGVRAGRPVLVCGRYLAAVAVVAVVRVSVARRAPAVA